MWPLIHVEHLVNEVDSRYEAVLDAPVLPLFPGNNGVWSVLMDGMTVDGQTVPLPPSQAGAPPGKLVVTMDTGTPGAELLPPFVDAIYSRIPGAELVEISDGSQLWTLPCNTTTIVSLQFGSVFTHLGAILLIVITAVNRFLSTRWTCQKFPRIRLAQSALPRGFHQRRTPRRTCCLETRSCATFIPCTLQIMPTRFH